MATLWKVSSLLLALALAGAGVVIVRQRHALRDLQARLNTEDTSLTAASANKKELSTKLQAAEKKIQDLDGQVASLAAVVEAHSGEAAAGHRKGQSEITKEWLEKASDPATVARLQARARKQVAARYAGLISKLGLDDAASEQLITLLAEKKLAATDVAVSSIQAGNGQNVDGDALASSVAAVRSNLDSEIKTLLGPSGYDAYRGYEIQAGQAGVVADVQAALASTASPLTDQQAAMLQQVLQANNIGHITDKVVGQSQTFLNPDQLQALQNLQLRESKGSLSHVPQ